MLDNVCIGVDDNLHVLLYLKVQYLSWKDINDTRYSYACWLLFFFFLYRGGNFNKDYDRKMVTKVWLDSAGVAFIFWVFCRNIVHFFERFDIHVVCNSCSGMQKWNYQLEEKKILISVLPNKKDFMVHVCKE